MLALFWVSNSIKRESIVAFEKHIIRCYSRLAQNLRAREALRQVLPNQLQDGTFNDLLKSDQS